MLRITCFLLAIIAVSGTATAQQPRYNNWAPPGSETSGGDLQTFIDRLNRLVDEAEKARAADPRFLRDLRDLANGFDRPWKNRVISDAFTDGNYTSGPAWSVRSGKYWVEQNWGLRSDGQGSAATAQQQDRKLDGKDAAVAILGAILQGAAGGNSSGSGQQQNSSSGGEPAVITTTAAITNAFAIEVELSSWKNSGSFAIGPYQGDSPNNGYRLLYSSGQPLELQRVSSRRGVAIIDRGTEAVTIEDQELHRLEWTRQTNGAMTVKLDGKEMLSVTDVGFRDPFAGLAVSNNGSDIILRQVEVLSVP